jgi:hypothetical protein
MLNVTRLIRQHIDLLPTCAETGAVAESRKRRLHAIVTISHSAAVATLICALTAILFYDQNGTTFYLHDGAAAVFVAAQPVVSAGYTAVMIMTSMGGFSQVVGSALVVVSAASVAAMLLPLLRAHHDLLVLCVGLLKLDHGMRELEVGRLANIAWWFPVSELALLTFTYLWYLLTAITTGRDQNRNK